MLEVSPCNECYQCDPYEMFGTATYVETIIDVEDGTPGIPSACFFYVCGDGIIAALNRIRQAKRGNETGLLPFGSAYKPFINNYKLTGRFVAWKEREYKDGDILIKTNSRYCVTTNIFTYKPPG